MAQEASQSWGLIGLWDLGYTWRSEGTAVVGIDRKIPGAHGSKGDMGKEWEYLFPREGFLTRPFTADKLSHIVPHPQTAPFSRLSSHRCLGWEASGVGKGSHNSCCSMSGTVLQPWESLCALVWLGLVLGLGFLVLFCLFVFIDTMWFLRLKEIMSNLTGPSSMTSDAGSWTLCLTFRILGSSYMWQNGLRISWKWARDRTTQVSEANQYSQIVET